jgi:drug/metabolite transporter (DMT)-like permease
VGGAGLPQGLPVILPVGFWIIKVGVVNATRVNALTPIVSTLLGIVILVKLEQSINAHIPILVTLLGIVILVKLEHPENA